MSSSSLVVSRAECSDHNSGTDRRHQRTETPVTRLWSLTDGWSQGEAGETVTTSVYQQPFMLVRLTNVFRHNGAINKGWIVEWNLLKLKWRRGEETDRYRYTIHIDIFTVNNTKQWVSVLVIPCNPLTRIVSVSDLRYYVSRVRSQCYKLSGVTLDKSASKPLGHKGIM